ncbi:Penicillin-binding protein [Sphingobium herbicidovorans NBRC 16415]|uniref:Penicillin-binding protein 1A n=1 Tax=Sphingobium herbicidovorans (strain ATCC 700291 / DSM 11019 / CCUG 56400 / KCTC 2939 / LMG 18315 / NBRC 16415 / MH) TaxID=1219045 RepID=A0A086P7A9_SPHHM|nr:transglycosylase domain-containing protein [Sphingobium herbicidovorans]KFG89277.1 Penicillin-binding protein [Sphingobium herbicidovorans NBRC 16415]
MEEARPDTARSSLAARLRGHGGAFRERLAPLWSRRWFRWVAIALGGLFTAMLLFWLIFARGLPDAATLLEYEPPLPTIVRDINGQPVHSYARERRVQLQYSDYPPLLIRAYLAAEDKTFFEHHGVDIPGFAGAVVDYATKIGSGQRAKGGSTITQQVAKNLLIGDEYSPTRKVKEMILAYRMEGVLTKQQILELYFNQIFLGRNAYGVQAAARAYFDKDVADLELHEMAYLAILPKGPANYRPESPTGLARALDRRNWALGEMFKNGWITQAQLNEAQAQPLGTVAPHSSGFDARAGGYYMEEVRRRLIDLFGEKAEDGPNSVYAGGLWVRSPYDPKLQEGVATALRNGLLRFDAGKGWSGPVGKIDMGRGWQRELAASYIGIDYANWRIAVVIDRNSAGAEIGFADGSTGTLPAGAAQMPYRRAGGPAFNSMKPGDLIAVAPNGTGWALRNVPEVSGGMLAEQTHSGRVLAMQGGFDSRLSSYNRATQAMRQPGSTIKPFVYAAALDNGMTPASIIVDGPLCVYQGAGLGQKCFRNFSGGSAGPQTMRWGVEQSRNLMTVRAASQTGMDRVVRTIKAMGIGDYQPYLSFALGAGETTVERMVNAYATLANHGRQLPPKVMDYVQDRRGKVIWPLRWRACEGCNMANWDGKPMPRFGFEGRQVMNPMTAYQVVHITEGVIQRGTATVLADLKRPLFGKTGTTNGPTNVWFVGGSPDIVAGVYIGYDQPRSLGGWAQGGRVAAPIWKAAMAPVLETMPKTPFVAPAGIRMVTVDRRSGKRVYGVWPTEEPKPAVIWEAFKPETEPRRSIRKEEVAAQEQAAQRREAGERTRPRTDSDFLQDQGGIY